MRHTTSRLSGVCLLFGMCRYGDQPEVAWPDVATAARHAVRCMRPMSASSQRCVVAVIRRLSPRHPQHRHHGDYCNATPRHRIRTALRCLFGERDTVKTPHLVLLDKRHWNDQYKQCIVLKCANRGPKCIVAHCTSYI